MTELIPSTPKSDEIIEAQASRRIVEEASNSELTLEERMEQIRKLVTTEFDGQSPDVLFSHSGGIKHETKTGAYRSSTYSDLTSDHGQATGGRTRVIATGEIAKAFPDLPIVTNSYNRFDPSEPSMASIVKTELVDRGVGPARIMMEESSFSTVTQMVEMVKEAVANNWTRISAMTNYYHYPRMSAMYAQLDTIIEDDEFQKTLQKFKEMGAKVEFVKAEDILRLLGPHFIEYLAAVEKSPGFIETVAAEAQGLKDLQAGKYRVTLKPEAPRTEE